MAFSPSQHTHVNPRFHTSFLREVCGQSGLDPEPIAFNLRRSIRGFDDYDEHEEHVELEPKPVPEPEPVAEAPPQPEPVVPQVAAVAAAAAADPSMAGGAQAAPVSPVQSDQAQQQVLNPLLLARMESPFSIASC